ncbi:hypothetical protein LRP31_16320 [Mesorhizobium mediterraneum]|nr:MULTISPECIES: hypothetical protein [Mesorhizobium]WIW56614.1 hypothetical protein LRP31_16320 [Mesorhizobium mediterraneum]
MPGKIALLITNGSSQAGILWEPSPPPSGFFYSRKCGDNRKNGDKWRQAMLTKILAASLLAAGLATSAMAQNASDPDADMGTGSDRSVVTDPAPIDPNLAEPNTVDPGITGSIIAGPDGLNSNADQNCPIGPQGAMPDATNKAPGTVSPTVNDNHCGK